MPKRIANEGESNERARKGGAAGTKSPRISETTNPAATFEPHRRRLAGLAYRMLGSMAEAEDAVQETYLRWHDADRERIENPRAFLVTTTTRICLDVLKSARARREEYVGPWLPEPVTDTAALAPDAQTELAEDLSIALLLALERLSPLERAAFLLHDVFDYSFGEIANTLERKEGAVRQLASRARARVKEARPRGGRARAGGAVFGSVVGQRPIDTGPVADDGPPVAHRAGPAARHSGRLDPKHAELLTAFMHASRSGDTATLTRLLAGDAKIATDGGGKVAAALNVIQGADRVAAFLVGVVRKGWKDDFTARLETVNGLPGIIVHSPAGVIQTNAFEIDEGVITAIYVVRNPDKLRHLQQ